jgi:hypothetical protein
MPLIHLAPEHRMSPDGISMEAEIDDQDINVDPYEPNAPSRRGDAELERNLRLIDETNRGDASR